jgi:hypothetical protein
MARLELSADEAIRLAIPQTGSADDAKPVLANSIPGWDELTETQQTEFAELVVARRDLGLPVEVVLAKTPGGATKITLPDQCQAYGYLKLQKAFAAASLAPVNARANELLTYLGSVSADSSQRYNAALSFIESMEPRTQAEALLLVQMYVTHDAAIRALSQLGSAEWLPTMQTFGNLATKLLRLSQGQMETLARMRRGGEQIVRHIHVDNRGGQAVIAENVNAGAKETGKIDDQSHATGAVGLGASLPSSNPIGEGVPISSRERSEEVPNARRNESRGT